MVRVLPNGLTVLTVARHGNPLAAVVLRVGVGSADEEPPQEGYAHAVEHLVVRCAMDGGRDVSVRTGKDATTYATLVRRGGLAGAVAGLGAVFDPLQVPPGELAAELAGIGAERAQRQADPEWRLRESLLAGLWRGTRAAHPVLGDPLVLDALRPEHAAAFHRTWYCPANSLLAVVADHPDEVLPTVLRWRDGTGPDPVGGPHPAVLGVAVPGGVAIAERRAWSPRVRVAQEAVRAATGLRVRVHPVRGWLCVWTTGFGATAAAACRAAHDRVAGPDGPAWLRAAVLIPMLREEDDLAAVAARAAETSVSHSPGCSAAEVVLVLRCWERRFAAVAVS